MILTHQPEKFRHFWIPSKVIKDLHMDNGKSSRWRVFHGKIWLNIIYKWLICSIARVDYRRENHENHLNNPIKSHEILINPMKSS